MGASLITASALLDMMTADELQRLVASCARAGCPVLITLSVTGRVDLTPADPLDHAIADAFNAHQRRTTGAGQPPWSSVSMKVELGLAADCKLLGRLEEKEVVGQMGPVEANGLDGSGDELKGYGRCRT